MDIGYSQVGFSPVESWAAHSVQAIGAASKDLHERALDLLAFGVGGALAHNSQAQKEEREFTPDEAAALFEESNALAREAAHKFVDDYFDDEAEKFATARKALRGE